LGAAVSEFSGTQYNPLPFMSPSLSPPSLSYLLPPRQLVKSQCLKGRTNFTQVGCPLPGVSGLKTMCKNSVSDRLWDSCLVCDFDKTAVPESLCNCHTVTPQFSNCQF
jgi:hypothetical protein